MGRRIVAGALASIVALSITASARAQDKTFSLDRLTVGGAPDDGIGLWRPEMSATPRVHGQLGVGFAADPLRVSSHVADARDAARLRAAGGESVTTQTIAYVDAGVQVLDRFDFSIEVPVIAAQTGNATSLQGTSATTNVDMMTTAVMDVRLDARAVFWRSPSRKLKLGVHGALWLPTGNEYSYAGDREASGAFGVAGEADAGRFFVVLDTGVQLRPMSTVNDLVVSDEWRWGGGAFVPLRDGALRLGVEVFGSTGLADGTAFRARNTALEWMVEGRLATDAARRGWIGLGGGTRLMSGLAPDMRAVAVAGYAMGLGDVRPRSPSGRFVVDRPREADTDHDGYPDDEDLCPNDPEDGKPPNPTDGCPALPDDDGDGIPNVSDKCPTEAEDFDHVQDLDGCPEDDADKDGVPDAVDACPTVPGEPSPEPSRNGCSRVIEDHTGSLRLFQAIEFETGRATILPRSYPIIDAILGVLKVNPDITHVSIEGHTDNRGSDDLNEKLSDERAHSVMRYLVERGVTPARLSAEGFGPRRPIADNGTAEGRAKNRRVEFKLSR